MNYFLLMLGGLLFCFPWWGSDGQISASRPDLGLPATQSESFQTALKTYPPDTGLLLDLTQSGLNGGLSVPQILGALGKAAGLSDLVYCSRALLLGVDWQSAWTLVAESKTKINNGHQEYRHRFLHQLEKLFLGDSNRHNYGQILSEALQPAWSDGVDPQPLLESAANQFRQLRIQQAKQAAQKLSIRLVLPLGLCQLPAFILLGLVPTVLGGINVL